jgi:hypothetical protein
VCDASECKETTEYSVQNTTGGRNLQYTRKYPKPSTPTTAKDRVWRRLVNPPIR